MTPKSWLKKYGPREFINYDVIIVGAGPAGLSTAIRLKQLTLEYGKDLSICILEKGSELGAHILSGAVMDPKAFLELFPNFSKQDFPLNLPVLEERFLFLSASSSIHFPKCILPKNFHNDGNYIISLGDFVKWLGKQAQALDVEIFPGFAAAELLYNESGELIGIATNNVGVKCDGIPGDNFHLGIGIRAKYIIFAEGARGHLRHQLESRYALNIERDPQVYGIGIKEIWEVDSSRHTPGLVIHTIGWPLDMSTYGGSFIYHMKDNRVAIGLIVGLDYQNPYFSPFEEFQRYKTHPSVKYFLEGGNRIAYGARAIATGGLVSLPKLAFPGGVLIGCEAGFLNPLRSKGIHCAIKSGMIAADAVFEAIQEGRSNDTLDSYETYFKQSWLYEELYQARNTKQWMSKNLYLGMLMIGIEQKLFGGKIPWTLHHPCMDHERFNLATKYNRIIYPKPDNIVTFDRLSSLYLSNVYHTQNQPSHLLLKDPTLPVQINLKKYGGPETRYCPAAVYQFIHDSNSEEKKRLQVNSQNCLHCKVCDIKDPTQNIIWIPPQGGEGPNYSSM